MTRRSMLIAGAIAVVAVGLVVAQSILTRPSSPTPTTAEQPDSSLTPSAGAITSSAPPSSAASRTAAAGNPDAADGPIDPLPGGERLEPVPATGPARSGERLHPLSTSPTTLISGFVAGKVPNRSAYAIRFRPWGYGRVDRRGQTVVVTVDSARPMGSAPGVPMLKGANLLLVMDRHGHGGVAIGGSQAGVLTFVLDGKRLVPTLSAVRLPAP